MCELADFVEGRKEGQGVLENQNVLVVFTEEIHGTCGWHMAPSANSVASAQEGGWPGAPG